MSSRGTRSLTIDVRDLPEGMYHCVVSQNGFSMTRPLQVIR
jgi:hypothetical protein